MRPIQAARLARPADEPLEAHPKPAERPAGCGVHDLQEQLQAALAESTPDGSLLDAFQSAAVIGSASLLGWLGLLLLIA